MPDQTPPAAAPQTYAARLATWAVSTAVILAVMVLNALVARWIPQQPQPPVTIQPPPVLVVSPDGQPLAVTVVHPR